MSTDFYNNNKKLQILINNQRNDAVDFVIRLTSELQAKSNRQKEYICKMYLKKLIDLQSVHEAEREELRDELKRHDLFDLNIIKRQINDINRLCSERDDFSLRMYNIIFKNSTSSRLDLNISFTVSNTNYKKRERNYENISAALREDQKKDTLKEIMDLINRIHYMTTKAEYESMIEESKYYLKQCEQVKVLSRLKTTYDINDDVKDTSIGSILNYVFHDMLIGGKIFKPDGLYTSGRIRLIAVKMLIKLYDLINKDIFSYETECEDVYDKLLANYDTYQGIKII
jgi:hypothetical protein